MIAIPSKVTCSNLMREIHRHYYNFSLLWLIECDQKQLYICVVSSLMPKTTTTATKRKEHCPHSIPRLRSVALLFLHHDKTTKYCICNISHSKAYFSFVRLKHKGVTFYMYSRITIIYLSFSVWEIYNFVVKCVAMMVSLKYGRIW